MIKNDKLKELENNMTLLYTGKSRFASNIAKNQKKIYKKKISSYSTLYQLALEAKNIIEKKYCVKDLGLIMNESWKIKKTLSDKVSNIFINNIYDVAESCGVYGGKILGAGGGGFYYFLQQKIKKKLKSKLKILWKFLLNLIMKVQI